MTEPQPIKKPSRFPVLSRVAKDVSGAVSRRLPAEPPPVAVIDKPKRLRAGAILFLALFAALFLWASWRLPISRALEPLPDPTLVLLASDGTPLARMGSYKDTPVDAETLPEHVRMAFVAVEDRRFYSHFGLDLRGLARAFWIDVKSGRYVQGGSTLTQQLAKNSFLDGRRSLRRKVQEVLISFWLEFRLNKNEILSRYLSSVYFGDGTYGLRAAARHYFDKAPEDLDLGEAAMLAGIVNAPSKLAPTRNLKGARERARIVLITMAQVGAVSVEQARAAVPATPRVGRAHLTGGGYFTDWAAGEARDTLDPGYGEAKVLTTLDRGLQRDAERIVARVLKRKGARLGATQAALIAMRRDGRVVAMVGGRDYAESRFNRATQAKRQPGSAFKTFVYLAALRDGMTPDSRVEDTPLTIGAWSPANYEDRYRGELSLREAFAHSSNVAAVRLSERVGRGDVIRAARDLGITSPLAATPSLPLGAQETTLLEMTGAYASIAAGLRPIRPQALAAPQKGVRRLPARERVALLDLMRASVQEGTGRAASLKRLKAYGKTGTTSDYRDAVFIGFAGDLVVGVWVGNDDHSPMRGVTGGSLPAEIWRAFVSEAMEERPDLRRVGNLAAEPLSAPDGWWSRLKRFLGLEPEPVVPTIEPPRSTRRATRPAPEPVPPPDIVVDPAPILLPDVDVSAPPVEAPVEVPAEPPPVEAPVETPVAEAPAP